MTLVTVKKNDCSLYAKKMEAQIVVEEIIIEGMRWMLAIMCQATWNHWICCS